MNNDHPSGLHANLVIRAWDAATEDDRREFFNAREFEIYAARATMDQMNIDAHWRGIFQ
jgi:hypothetical protein